MGNIKDAVKTRGVHQAVRAFKLVRERGPGMETPDPEYISVPVREKGIGEA